MGLNFGIPIKLLVQGREVINQAPGLASNGVPCLGFRVQDLGVRVQDLGCLGLESAWVCRM